MTMAEGKKIVSVYVEWGDLFEKLTDEEAGRLIKHFFRYIDDQNPEAPDRLTDIAFEPIKKQLQRDLIKWRDKCQKNKENARIRWDANACERKKSDANHADEDEVEDEVEDKVEDEDIIREKKFSFKKSLIALGVEEALISDWMLVRKQKKAANTETAFKSIKREIELTGLSANECIRIAVEKSWQGFNAAWLKPSHAGYQHPSMALISNELTKEQLKKF